MYMSNYRMALSFDKNELEIPVLPEKLEVKSAGRNEKAEVVSLGEITIIRQRGLKEISWSSLFPVSMQPFVNGYLASMPILSSYSHSSVNSTPMKFVQLIQRHRDAKKALWFNIAGSNLDLNMRVAIQNFEYYERFGEPGDVYYTISLREWIDYSPRKVELKSKEDGSCEADIQNGERPGTPPDLPQQNSESAAAGKTASYVVRQDDNLWKIAQTVYGDGSKWTDIYNKSKTVIDDGNSVRRAFAHELAAGQVLSLL